MNAEEKIILGAIDSLDEIIRVLEKTKKDIKSQDQIVKITAIMTAQVFHDFLLEKDGFSNKMLNHQKRIMALINEDRAH